MRRLLLAALVLLLAAACGTGGDASSDADAPAEPGGAVIERVVDGDTVVVRIQGREEKVRLIGIDTPETHDPRRPVECFGREATERTNALLPEGTPVRLVRDVEARDRYDRLLAYIYRAEDDLFVNLTLAREGFAAAATYPPNVAHTDEFVRAAGDARRAGRGLWSVCGGTDTPVASGM
jgi:micrococcal nuclease